MKRLAYKRLKKGSESNALAYLWGYLKGLEHYEHITPQDIARLRGYTVEFFPELFEREIDE